MRASSKPTPTSIARSRAGRGARTSIRSRRVARLESIWPRSMIRPMARQAASHQARMDRGRHHLWLGVQPHLAGQPARDRAAFCNEIGPERQKSMFYSHVGDWSESGIDLPSLSFVADDRNGLGKCFMPERSDRHHPCARRSQCQERADGHRPVAACWRQAGREAASGLLSRDPLRGRPVLSKMDIGRR